LFVDSFDGTMFGGWLFTVLLKQDPIAHIRRENYAAEKA